MGEVPRSPGVMSWRKSSASADGDCLEVAQIQEYVWIRDSKNPSGLVLGCSPEGWAVFLGGVRGDEFAPNGESV